VTGYGQEDDHRPARDAGFDAHLVKPVDFERLRQVIEAVLGDGRDRPPGLQASVTAGAA
jgi:CheY-like chemotaxis protein